MFYVFVVFQLQYFQVGISKELEEKAKSIYCFIVNIGDFLKEIPNENDQIHFI